MYKTILVSTLVLLSALSGRAQANKEVRFRFAPTFEHKNIVLEEASYNLPDGGTVVFEEFKCYISDIKFYKGEELVFAETNSFHLIDARRESSMTFMVKMSADITYSSVKMNIGVDSVTSTSGALGGDLDPAKGMFWTWQSGYINLKLEGRSNKCPTRKNRFQFHLGGYAQAENTLQAIQINTKPGKDIAIDIPLDQFLREIDLAQLNTIMSPGPEAVALSKKIALLFSGKGK